ncbi:MAG: response regulator [Magnetococcales bacterium]|nr:response regulator [Magnetococcales bacterium]NGZ26767.1 response regulator [Magnetococcales bacterium]
MAHILIVDDQPDIRSMLAMRLELQDHTIEQAENGAVGLEMARQGRFDLILLDMHMPVMDGHEMVRLLRQEGYAGLVVAVTASAMVSDTHRAIQAGCNDFIFKPVSEDFEERIEQLLRKRISP